MTKGTVTKLKIVQKNPSAQELVYTTILPRYPLHGFDIPLHLPVSQLANVSSQV